MSGAMKPSVRRLWLGLALAATIAAMVAVDHGSQDVPLAEPVIKDSRPDFADNASSHSEAGALVRLSVLKRPAMEISETNPFAPKSWYVAPPPPPVQNIKSVPPPLPFSYKGKLEESDGRPLFYLAKGDESFVVAVGDTFGGSYKLESARDDALIIRYLPISVTQTLRYGPEL